MRSKIKAYSKPDSYEGLILKIQKNEEDFRKLIEHSEVIQKQFEVVIQRMDDTLWKMKGKVKITPAQ
jgi:hypothetical protein